MAALVHSCSQGSFQVEIKHSTAVNAVESSIRLFNIASASCTIGAVRPAHNFTCSSCSLLQYFLLLLFEA